MRILTILLTVLATTAGAGEHRNFIFPGFENPGDGIDKRCSVHYHQGWHHMNSGDRTYYVLFCNPRGWA